MDSFLLATGIGGYVAFLVICVGGVLIMFRPRLYRIAIWTLVFAALASLFLVVGPGKRVAVANYESDGGTYTNEMAKLFFSYISVNFMFLAVVAACVIVLGMIALKLLSSRGQV